MVTLGIIGVVSAMTLPTLVKNHQRQTYVVQLHKIFNEFQQGLEMQMTERNAVNLNEAGLNANSAGDFLKSHFKVVKDCGKATGCFASNYSPIDGGAEDGASSAGPSTDSYYRVSISSGASIALELGGTGGDSDRLGSIYVDTNGVQGPNIAGRDYFRIYVYSDGTLDDNGVTPNCRRLGGSTNCSGSDTAQALREVNFTSQCTKKASNNYGCLGKIINDGWQMTY